MFSHFCNALWRVRASFVVFKLLPSLPLAPLLVLCNTHSNSALPFFHFFHYSRKRWILMKKSFTINCCSSSITTKVSVRRLYDEISRTLWATGSFLIEKGLGTDREERFTTQHRRRKRYEHTQDTTSRSVRHISSYSQVGIQGRGWFVNSIQWAA